MAQPKRKQNLPLFLEGYSYDELMPLVRKTLLKQVSVLVRGHPGVGKSSMAAELCEAMGLPLIDIRLAQRDPAELGGVYFPDKETQTLALFAPPWVRKAVEQPVFLFLDEINAAVTKLHQSVAYQIVLEHRVGPFQFHPDTVVLAAGNMEEDGAIVSSLSTPLCNRFAHFTLRADIDSWLKWASKERIHPAIMAYIARYGDTALYQSADTYAFPTPRTWAMASRLLEVENPLVGKRLATACVGIEAAEKLFTFIQIFHRVDPQKIILKGQVMDFTKGRKAEPSFIYAAVFSVAAWLVNEAELPDDKLCNIVKFLESPGLDPEYGFLFLRHLKNAPDLLQQLRHLKSYQRLAGGLVALHAGLFS
jgi:hypothetical protein